NRRSPMRRKPAAPTRAEGRRKWAEAVVAWEEARYVEGRQEAAEAEASRRRLAAGVDDGLWETFRVESHATQQACGRQRAGGLAAGLPEAGGFRAHYPEPLLEATDELCAAARVRAADGGLALGALFRRWWPTPPSGKWPDRLPEPPPPPRELPRHPLW